MHAQAKVQDSTLFHSKSIQNKPVQVRPVAVAGKGNASMMSKEAQPAPARYDFVGIAG